MSDLPTNDELRRIWDANASTYDARLSRPSSWQQTLVFPAVEELAEIRAGESVLEIACGSGLLAERLAAAGARVVAADLSEGMLDATRARLAGTDVEVRAVDATDPEQLRALSGPFDACVATMALMDMSTVEPLAEALPSLLAPRGRFVFSVTHPSFNNGRHSLVTEVREQEDGYAEEHAVKVWGYSTPRAHRGIGIVGQPELQWYFHRSLSDLLGPFLASGLALDALREPVFDDETARVNDEYRVWTEVPPILVARLRNR